MAGRARPHGSCSPTGRYRRDMPGCGGEGAWRLQRSPQRAGWPLRPASLRREARKGRRNSSRDYISQRPLRQRCLARPPRPPRCIVGRELQNGQPQGCARYGRSRRSPGPSRFPRPRRPSPARPGSCGLATGCPTGVTAAQRAWRPPRRCVGSDPPVGAGAGAVCAPGRVCGAVPRWLGENPALIFIPRFPAQGR